MLFNRESHYRTYKYEIDGVERDLPVQDVFLVSIKTESNGITSEDINALERNLQRRSLITDNQGIIVTFICLTDNPEGLNDEVNYLLIPEEVRGNYLNDYWYLLETLDLTNYGIAPRDMDEDNPENEVTQPIIHVIPAKYRFTESSPGYVFGQIPHYGHRVRDPLASLNPEEKEKHKASMFHYMRMVPNTPFNEFADNKYQTGFMSFWNGSFRSVREKFLADAFSIQNSYGSNVQKFLEDAINEDPTLESYGTKPMITMEYPINDDEKVAAMNEYYSENVRAFYPEKNANNTESNKSDDDQMRKIKKRWLTEDFITKNLSEQESKDHWTPGIARQVYFVSVDKPEEILEDRFASIWLAETFA